MAIRAPDGANNQCRRSRCFVLNNVFFPDEDTCPQHIEYILDVNFGVDVDDFVVSCCRGEIT